MQPALSHMSFILLSLICASLMCGWLGLNVLEWGGGGWKDLEPIPFTCHLL